MTFKRYPGFTLLEVLITSVIFVATSIVVSGIAGSILRVQMAHKQSQAINSQSQRVVEEIAKDLEVALTVTDSTGAMISGRQFNRDGIIIHRFIDSPDKSPVKNVAHDYLMAVVVPQRDSKGAIPASPTYEKHVYCAEVQFSGTTPMGKRMARYTIDANTTFDASTFDATTAVRYCSPSAMNRMFKDSFGIPITPPVADYLTDPTFQVVNLRFWPVWGGAAVGSQRYELDPPGVRVEIVSQYSLTNTPGSTIGEFRVSDRFSTPAQIVNRTTLFRDAGRFTRMQ